MSALFSLKLWFIFLQRIINTLYPANIISLIFLYPVRKKIKINSPMRFIFILLLIDIAIRMFAFFSGIPFSHRYLYPMMILITIFSGLGMISFIHFLRKYLIKKFPTLTEKTVTISIILILIFSYSGKALHHSDDKKWLKDIAFLIKANLMLGTNSEIISNYDESRFLYYSGCGELLIFSPKKKFQMCRHVKHENDSKWIVETKGRNAFLNYLKSSTKELFIIYRIKKSKIKSNITSLFPETKMIGHFYDKRRKYQYFVFKKIKTTKKTEITK